MKASFVIPSDGTYQIRVEPATFEKDAPAMQMRIYRNRTRLLATESTYASNWRGHLDANDLIEADGEFDVTLTVSPETTDAHHTDPRDDHARHAIAPV